MRWAMHFEGFPLEGGSPSRVRRVKLWGVDWPRSPRFGAFRVLKKRFYKGSRGNHAGWGEVGWGGAGGGGVWGRSL